ncbi:MAG: hypothetical protein ACKN9W_17715 [Methylococcus sp.]
MNILIKHPLVILGMGLAVGIYAYRHRKEIAEAAAQGSERAREAFMKPSDQPEEVLAATPNQ